MKKIIVIGCPGSGKSTFAKRLQQKLQLPLCHLDLLFWNADRTTVERAVFRERLEQVLQTEEWIIDGNYASTMELRMQHCDTVIFLDYPLELCLQGVAERRGKPRTDMPWIETEEDAEFMAEIRKFPAEGRLKVLALLEQYPQKNILIFKDRAQTDAFLEQ